MDKCPSCKHDISQHEYTGLGGGCREDEGQDEYGSTVYCGCPMGRKDPDIRTPRQKILDAINAERDRQLEKWGVQHHPLSKFGHTAAGLLAKSFKEENDREAVAGTLTWENIFLEELYEALAEEEKEKIVGELVQLAAVVVAVIEDLSTKRT